MHLTAQLLFACVASLTVVAVAGVVQHVLVCHPTASVY
jgi:hypothetical protein